MSRFGAWVEPVRGDSGFLRKEQERERQEQLEGIAYWDLFEQIDAERKAEWIADGGDERDYKSNSTEIHHIVTKKMEQIELDRDD